MSNPGDHDGSDLSDDTSGLPFPEPLSRSSFLSQDFDSATFLASLRSRHQSLEDLRKELRDLDQSLAKELLDLVNENYQDFLSLGSALRGGEEKIEQLRVGLLAFQRDSQSIRDRVESRRADMEQLLKEKRRLRQERSVGLLLLDIADRVEELEQRLMIGHTGLPKENASDETGSESTDLDDDSSESDEDPGDTSASPVSLKRLERDIRKYAYLTGLVKRAGSEHPFLRSLETRIGKIKSALLLDLSTVRGRAARSSDGSDLKSLAVLRLYNIMREETSAVSAQEA